MGDDEADDHSKPMSIDSSPSTLQVPDVPSINTPDLDVADPPVGKIQRPTITKELLEMARDRLELDAGIRTKPKETTCSEPERGHAMTPDEVKKYAAAKAHMQRLINAELECNRL